MTVSRNSLPRLPFILRISLPAMAFGGLWLSGSAQGATLTAAPANGVEHRYMVVLREQPTTEGPYFTTRPVQTTASRLAATYGGTVERVWTHALKGFVIHTDPASARRLANDPNVKGVYQDTRFSVPIADCSQGVATQTALASVNSPQSLECVDPDPQNPTGVCVDNWGIDRIDQRTSTRDQMYTFGATGQGVHVYIVDSGLYANHNAFNGRVGQGYNAVDGSTDTNDLSVWGHGTHVAGIIGSSNYGVAKEVTLHSVKVSKSGTPYQDSFIVSAFDWIRQNHDTSTDGPAVVNISMNPANVSNPEHPMSMAAKNLIEQGEILIIESAGNHNDDACTRIIGESSILVVGGMDEFDTPWERQVGDPNYSGWCTGAGDCGSNHGSCVDIFAPAAHIVSTWSDNVLDPTHQCRLSGTSMAAPHATGAAALYLQHNPTATPAQVTQALIDNATADTLTELRPGSPNRLLYIGNFPLSGQGQLSVTPSSAHDFGTVMVGDQGTALQLELANSGTDDLDITRVTLGGDNAKEFSVTADCDGEVLSAAATCEVDVNFVPMDEGAKVAMVVIESSDPGNPTTSIALSGTATLSSTSTDSGGSDGSDTAAPPTPEESTGGDGGGPSSPPTPGDDTQGSNATTGNGSEFNPSGRGEGGGGGSGCQVVSPFPPLSLLWSGGLVLGAWLRRPRHRQRR